MAQVIQLPETEDPIQERIRSNVDMLKKFLLQQQLQKQITARQAQPSTTMTRKPRTFGETTKARETLLHTPESLWKDSATRGVYAEEVRAPVSRIEPAAEAIAGRMGRPETGFVQERDFLGRPKTRRERHFTPGFKEQRAEAQKVIDEPYTTAYSTRFRGAPGGYGEEEGEGNLQALIDEYNTTTDPARLKELEALLEQMGVTFQ